MLCLACGKKEEGIDVVDVTGGSLSASVPKDAAKERPSGGKQDESDAANNEGAQRKSAQFDIIGQVESIIGNEAILTLMKDAGDGEYAATGETGAYLIPVGMQFGSGDYSSVSSGMILGFKIEDDTVMSVRILKRAS